MRIAYLKHSELDKQQWDELVERAPQRQVYAMSWYLDVVSPGWEAVVAIGEKGRYTIVMPVPWRKKLGIPYVQQPLFCQQLGLYASESTIAAEIYRAFVQKVQERFRYVVSYQFNTANILPAALSLSETQSYHTATHYLHLLQPYKELCAGYTRDRRMNLQRAKRAQLKIVDSDDIEPLITFFREETASRIYGGVAEEAYNLLRALYQELKDRGIGKLLYTLDASGRKNGGCLFIVWAGRIVYIFNAAPQHGRKQNGRTLILDHMISHYAGQDFILDFESPDETEEAIVHFYKSFGATTKPIPGLGYNRLPKGIKLIRTLRMQLVRKLKGLPNP